MPEKDWVSICERQRRLTREVCDALGSDQKEGIDWCSFFEEKQRFLREMSDAFRSESDEEWQSLAGPHYKKMLESCQATERFLLHEDRDVRLAALKVLTYVWRPGPENPSAAIIERMVFKADDQVMREAALCAFVDCYRNTSDPRVGRLLAEIATDESQPASWREFAYRSLYTLQGKFAPHWPGSQMTPPTPFRVPGDIDWVFVKSFL